MVGAAAIARETISVSLGGTRYAVLPERDQFRSEGKISRRVFRAAI
jgi:hypothetical protein